MCVGGPKLFPLQMSGQLIPILIVTLAITYILLATVGTESFLLFTDTSHHAAMSSQQ